jgi:Flp pilus assembly pilin Flp
MTKLLSRVIRDEQGTATIEYALVMGLIIVAAMSLIAALGTKVIGRWNVVKTGM